MALIKCPECQKDISDKATVCIHCGCPLETKNICGKIIIKALKHPRESQIIGHTLGTPIYGTSVKIYIISTDDHILAEIISGQTKTIDINEDINIYVSFEKPGKKGFFNLFEKTKSNIVKISAKKENKVQIGYNYRPTLCKLMLNEVDTFDSI